MNSAPPAMRSISSRRRRSSSSSIRVCVGSPGTFSTRKCVVGDARDLREVRDREHLRPLREALERGGDRMCGHAADARVDLVEHERLAAGHRRECERDPRELAAGRRVRDRRERKARVRPDEERRLVCARRSGLALPELDEELALPHPERGELVRDGFAEASRARLALGVERSGKLGRPLLGARHGLPAPPRPDLRRQPRTRARALLRPTARGARRRTTPRSAA